MNFAGEEPLLKIETYFNDQIPVYMYMYILCKIISNLVINF